MLANCSLVFPHTMWLLEMPCFSDMWNVVARAKGLSIASRYACSWNRGASFGQYCRNSQCVRANVVDQLLLSKKSLKEVETLRRIAFLTSRPNMRVSMQSANSEKLPKNSPHLPTSRFFYFHILNITKFG
jgi:hypothetical protein